MNSSRRSTPPSGLRHALLAAGVVLGLGAATGAAQAQDSFVRVVDNDTGAPVLSVLGTGLGWPYASLTLEMTCPAPGAWVIDVTGVRAPEGTAVAFGFGDPVGGWSQVRAASIRYDQRSLRFAIERASFREALSQARGGYPDARDAEARLVIGEAIGLSVNRDALVREMTAFARDCEAAAPAPALAPARAAPRLRTAAQAR